MHIIIFTDLDGTLLDEQTYSFDKALPALKKIRQLNIPLILTSSKTSKEIRLYQKNLGLKEPFIAENGGGIFIPKGYFPFDINEHNNADEYDIILLGKEYSGLRKSFAILKETFGNAIKGFGDMDAEEIIRLTGLSESEALLAANREFGEPFIILSNDDDLRTRVFAAITSLGLKYTKGNRFYYLMGDNDKGKACSILKKLYAQKYNAEIIAISLGDSYNDIPLLEQADYPILIKKHKGYENNINIPNLIKSEGIGPQGWNDTLLLLLSDLTS